jgi:amidase/aspartyl-tRNA(Asn)/glutamyl-tRNA(Gln) amidotransferase subunit A
MSVATEICFMSAVELAQRIRRRDLSPVEVVDAFLTRIDERNPDVNAYVTIIGEQARAAAGEAEARVMAGEALPALHGVPIALKDGHDTAGIRTTYGALPFADYVPTSDETPFVRLRAAGAVVLGKTNLPEFGHKATTDNPLFGPTRNPFNLDANAGGSSGGSAAAVADGMAAIAHGTDGGGSVRIPAAMCGVVGVIATGGGVPVATRPDAYHSRAHYGHHGTFARTVDDAAVMLSVMVGMDPRDPISVPIDAGALHTATRTSIAGLRVAYTEDFGTFPVLPEVQEVVRDAVLALQEAGARVDQVPVDLQIGHAQLNETWRRGAGVFYAEMLEMMAEHGHSYRVSRFSEFTPDFRSYVQLGRQLSALEYKLDDVVRTRVVDAFCDVFESHDVIVSPTVAVCSVPNASDGFTVGPRSVGGEPVDPLLGWVLTFPANFTGCPAASAPAGFTADGAPVGLQIIAPRFREDRVLATAAALERVRPWAASYRRLDAN